MQRVLPAASDLQKQVINDSLAKIASYLRRDKKMRVGDFAKWQYSRSTNKVTIFSSEISHIAAFTGFLSAREVPFKEIEMAVSGFRITIDEAIDALAEKLEKIAADLPKPLEATTSAAPPEAKYPTLFDKEDVLKKLQTYVTQNVDNANREEILERTKQGYIRLNQDDQNKFKQFLHDAFNALPEEEKNPVVSRQPSMGRSLFLLMCCFAFTYYRKVESSSGLDIVLFSIALYGMVHNACYPKREDVFQTHPRVSYYLDLLKMAEDHSLQQRAQPAAPALA